MGPKAALHFYYINNYNILARDGFPKKGILVIPTYFHCYYLLPLVILINQFKHLKLVPIKTS